MPLTQTSLQGRLVAELTTAATSLGLSVLSPTQLAKISEAIAKAVVDEIQANAQVQGQVTSGQGAGGSVEGTVT